MDTDPVPCQGWVVSGVGGLAERVASNVKGEELDESNVVDKPGVCNEVVIIFFPFLSSHYVFATTISSP